MKTEKNNDIDLLITQYLSGKLDKEAFAQLKDWASESEENRIYVKIKLKYGFLPVLWMKLVFLIRIKHLNCFKSV